MQADPTLRPKLEGDVLKGRRLLWRKMRVWWTLTYDSSTVLDWVLPFLLGALPALWGCGSSARC